jgi:hypothetical protein
MDAQKIEQFLNILDDFVNAGSRLDWQSKRDILLRSMNGTQRVTFEEFISWFP